MGVTVLVFVTHFRTNERTNGRTNERTDGRTKERTDGVTWSLLELLIAAKNFDFQPATRNLQPSTGNKKPNM